MKLGKAVRYAQPSKSVHCNVHSISTKLGVSTTSPLRPRLKITRKSWPELVTRDVKLDELSISVFAEEPVAGKRPLA
jgi:hypothetical protein